LKTILIVGAGRYQRAVIRRAKELGLRVVAADRNPDAPGFAEADVACVVDFADADALEAAVRDLGIDGVTTVQAERAVPIIARLAEALGVYGIGAETAHVMTNKTAMRRRLAEAGVPQPRFMSLRAAKDVAPASASIGFPAVIKPADASGQYGVARVESAEEALARLPEALAVSPTGDALLEEFVDGTEMNGIVVVRDGDALSVTLCDRLRPAGASFGVSWIHLYPASVEGGRRAEAERVAADAVRALGLETGVAFPQLLATTDGRIVVVECAARIGGLMAEHVIHARGIDLLEVQLRIALGESVPDELVQARYDRPVAVRFLTAEPGPLKAGRVTRVGSLERVLAAPGVVDAAVYAEEGEIIRPVMVISDRRGWVIAVGDTSAEALARAEAAASLVEIEVEVDT
jgi:biotin carboxylase